VFEFGRCKSVNHM